MTNQILFSIPLTEVEELQREWIRQELERFFEENQILNSGNSREELLNVHQVAELLHTTPQNIHAKKREGKIPFIRFGGKILFKRSEVIDSLKSINIKKAR